MQVTLTQIFHSLSTYVSGQKWAYPLSRSMVRALFRPLVKGTRVRGQYRILKWSWRRVKQILVVENSSRFDTSRLDSFLTRKTMTKKALPEIHEVSEL